MHFFYYNVTLQNYAMISSTIKDHKYLEFFIQSARGLMVPRVIGIHGLSLGF
jgi:hypothetical protein